MTPGKADKWLGVLALCCTADDTLFNPLRAICRARFGGTFSTALAPLLSQLSLLGVTFGGLAMQLSGPKTDFGAQGAPCAPQHKRKTSGPTLKPKK